MADTLVLVGRKSKGKMKICVILLALFMIQDIVFDSVAGSSECKGGCVEGTCNDGKCECDRGWAGSKCEKCYGRKWLNGTEGTIYDGEGNYTQDTKCSWLIQTNSENTTFRLRFRQFATECGWDHLYIHDGDSAFSPLLAAYSGLLLSKEHTYTEVDFFMRIHTPYIYIHFYSDAAYTMSGFNITYSIGDCLKGCSGNGDCEGSKCTCHAQWTGTACETAICPNNCSDSGRCINTQCQCDPGFRGDDCSVTTKEGIWSVVAAQSLPAGRASHTALIDNNMMWVVSGFALNNYTYHNLVRYDFTDNKWHEETSANESPPPRYGHSTVMYQNKLYVYGGVVDGLTVSDLWEYDINTRMWTNLTSSPLEVSGHTAHEFEGEIHVLFGYSPLYGYLNKVQIYNIENDTWHEAIASGLTVRGGYGHSSVWDPDSKKIYVYGGYRSGSSSNYNLTDILYSYDPKIRKWMLLKNSGSPRYLHAAVIMNGLMLTFGGNTHKDTTISYGSKCYSADFMAYDISCNEWHTLDRPQLSEEASRYGHTMNMRNGTMYVFGGFRGVMMNSLLSFKPGECEAFKEEKACTAATPGILCDWLKDRCQPRTVRSQCAADKVEKGLDCGLFTSCPKCASQEGNHGNCTWCDNKCVDMAEISTDCPRSLPTCNSSQDYACDHLSTCKACHDNPVCEWDRQTCRQKEGLKEQCPQPPDDLCGIYHSCGACIREPMCLWKASTSRCKSLFEMVEQEADLNVAPAMCPPPCSTRKSCKNCTSNTCMWCSNMQQCVGTNAYVASFPYGQCTEWTTKEAKCAETNCSGHHSCEECQAHPSCGWCNDPSNTGLGLCMEGGLEGSRGDTDQCPADQWYFYDCPKCQCNGHSVCVNNTGTCEDCQNHTTGNQCQDCQDGFHGNPENGGSCKECECYGQADSCDNVSGVCHCRTRGVTGDKCDRCDDTHKYFGDPKSGGTCYYQLVTDYQFTFNLSKADDTHYTQINFMNVPKASDKDVDFTLNCSGDALLNITHKSNVRNAEESYIISSYPCEYFRTKFEHKDYAFAGEENTTFRVYVYNFKTPFWLQISFSQFPKIDLVHFFVTFFSCFLSLLLIAAALWKIKHKYDSYRRRQQMMVEMQQMASRPFATVTVEIERKSDPEKKEHKETLDFRKRKRGGIKPAAISLEPLHNAKAAIMTCIIQLPTGLEEFAPCGQSGIAMGSTIIQYGGTTRKQSVEHIRDRSRLRKHLPSHHPQPDTSA